MAKDFRAEQIQTKQIIASGTLAGGSGAKLVIYSIDEQDASSPNQGVIDQNAFATSSLNGQDIFLFVSGGVSERNSSNRSISVFGGDLHVSGSITSDFFIVGSDTSASYVTLGATSSLENERILTAGEGISVIDNGPNNTVVISDTNWQITATPADSTLYTTSSILVGDNSTNSISPVSSSAIIAAKDASLANTQYSAIIGDRGSRVETTSENAILNVLIGSEFSLVQEVQNNVFAGARSVTSSLDRVFAAATDDANFDGPSSDAYNATIATNNSDLLSGSRVATIAGFNMDIGEAGQTANDILFAGGLNGSGYGNRLFAGGFETLDISNCNASAIIGSLDARMLSSQRSVILAGNNIALTSSQQTIVGGNSNTVDTSARSFVYGRNLTLTNESQRILFGSPNEDYRFIVSASQGSVFHGAGLSGSLTQLADGKPYLLGSTGITLVTNSLGQIEITGSATNTLDETINIASPDNDVIIPSSNPLRFVDGGVDGFDLVEIVKSGSGTGHPIKIYHSGSDPLMYLETNSTTPALRIQREGDVLDYVEMGFDQSFQFALSSRPAAGFINLFLDANAGSVQFKSRNSSTINVNTNDFIDLDDFPSYKRSIISGIHTTIISSSWILTGSTVGITSSDIVFGSTMPVDHFGSDVMFYVSGGLGTNKSVFGGDVHVTGTLISEGGFSGSLTQLADGSSYLLAGANISLSTGSNGAVTINASSGLSDTDWTAIGAGTLYSTSSLVAGQASAVEDIGSDIFFFVSGARGTDKSVFGGDVYASGSISAIVNTNETAFLAGDSSRQVLLTATAGDARVRSNTNSSLVALPGDSTSGAGKLLQLVGGWTQDPSGSGGAVNLKSGTSSHSTISTTGKVSVLSADAPAGGNADTGDISIYTGAPQGTGTPGGVAISATGTEGSLTTGDVSVEALNDIFLRTSGGGVVLSATSSAAPTPPNGYVVCEADRFDFTSRANTEAVTIKKYGTGSGPALIVRNRGTSGTIYAEQDDNIDALHIRREADISDVLRMRFTAADEASIDTTGNSNLTISTLQLNLTANESVFSSDAHVSGVLTSENGFSGSLTRLADGSSYLLAGTNISLSTGSNGAVTITSTGGGLTRQYLASYLLTTENSGSPQTAGAGYFVPSEHLDTSCTLRSVIATTTASNTALVQMYNVTSGTLVHIGGAGVTELTSSSEDPAVVESVNLLTATNFSTDPAIYEIRAYGSGSAPISIHYSSEIVCS